MSDRRLDDAALAAALVALGREIAYPPTPPIVPAVSAHLRSAERPAPPAPSQVWRRLARRRRLLVLVAVGAVLLLAGAAVATRLGIGPIGIRIVESPRPTTTPPPTGVAPVLGRPISLEEALAAAPFEVRLPSGMAQPDRVWLGEGTGPRVALAWRPDPGSGLRRIPGTPFGLVLVELVGSGPDVVKEIAVKEIEGSALRNTEVGGSPAFFIDEPHDLLLATGDGDRLVRVTGTVLIWQAGEVTYRLESALSLRAAVELAEAVG